MVWGSPQHKKLQERVTLLGRLRSAALGGGDNCLPVQPTGNSWVSLSTFTPMLQKASVNISLALGKPLQDGVVPLSFLPS